MSLSQHCASLRYFLKEKGDMASYSSYPAAVALIHARRPALYSLIQAYAQQQVIAAALRDQLAQELALAASEEE